MRCVRAEGRIPYLTPALRAQFDILGELLFAEAKATMAPADYRALKDCF
jgi:hypothetical protein